MSELTIEPVEAEPVPEVETFRVRLVFDVQASDPLNGVEAVIAQIVEHGLRTWSYHIENTRTHELFLADGKGGVEYLEDVLARENADDEDADEDEDQGEHGS